MDPKVEDSTFKVFIFRSVQELLFNVVKHGGVKSARVSLSSSDGALVITVSDEGEGFDPDILKFAGTTAGFGLLSMRERASFFGGDLSIESTPGKGSRFTLTIPLGQAKADELQLPSSENWLPRTTRRTGLADKTKAIRVLFADDHKVIRQGLISMISDQPNIQVVGSAADGRETLEKVRQLRPDVIKGPTLNERVRNLFRWIG